MKPPPPCAASASALTAMLSPPETVWNQGDAPGAQPAGISDKRVGKSGKRRQRHHAPQRHVRYRYVQDCRKARAGSSIMQDAAHGRRNARVPFKITTHQDGRDPDQNRRSEAVRVGVHRGCGCGHKGGHPRSGGDRLPLSMMVCYMTPIIRPSLSVFGWRCL